MKWGIKLGYNNIMPNLSGSKFIHIDTCQNHKFKLSGTLSKFAYLILIPFSSPEVSQSPTMSCEFCRRNVGLWNFTPLEQNAKTTNEDESEPTAKRLKVGVTKADMGFNFEEVFSFIKT